MSSTSSPWESSVFTFGRIHYLGIVVLLSVDTSSREVRGIWLNLSTGGCCWITSASILLLPVAVRSSVNATRSHAGLSHYLTWQMRRWHRVTSCCFFLFLLLPLLFVVVCVYPTSSHTDIKLRYLLLSPHYHLLSLHGHLFTPHTSSTLIQMATPNAALLHTRELFCAWTRVKTTTAEQTIATKVSNYFWTLCKLSLCVCVSPT